MDDANKGVTTEGAAPAPAQAVENAGAAAAKSPRELELEALLVKEREEKENYKQGLLRAKGKKSAKPIDLSDPVAAEEHVTQLVEDKLLEKKAEQEEKSGRDELEKLRLQVQEQDRIIKASRGTSAGGGSGSAPMNDPKPKNPNQYWTDEQRQELRDRGLNDAAITVAEDRARRGDFTSEQKNFLPTRTR